MSQPFRRQFLRCRHCHHVDCFEMEELLDRLRDAKMLRRNAQPSPDLLLELISECSSRWLCNVCGRIGLMVSATHPDEEVDWGDAKACETCGGIISAERLELLPRTTQCTDCQAKEESGVGRQDLEYCPRCGDVMQVRSRGGAGLAGYAMVCPGCRYHQ